MVVESTIVRNRQGAIGKSRFMKAKPKASTNGKFSNNAADYPGQWIAWDAGRKHIVAVGDDYLTVMDKADEVGEDDPLVERAPGHRPEIAKRTSELFAGESANIIEDIRTTIPDADIWLTAPNAQLSGRAPRDLIGTPDERFLRDILRRLWSGSFS
jgi:hypothetical protein